MLLLDEPTNHLDAESVGWLEQFLTEFPGTVVAITHDRYFLDNAAGWILELDRGHGIPYEGNYSAWLEAKEKRLATEQRQEQARQKTIKAELEWVRSQPKARQAKKPSTTVSVLKNSIPLSSNPEMKPRSYTFHPAPDWGEPGP